MHTSGCSRIISNIAQFAIERLMIILLLLFYKHLAILARHPFNVILSELHLLIAFCLDNKLFDARNAATSNEILCTNVSITILSEFSMHEYVFPSTIPYSTRRQHEFHHECGANVLLRNVTVQLSKKPHNNKCVQHEVSTKTHAVAFPKIFRVIQLIVYSPG